MKIIVIVRTRNEEANIRRFCQSYQWADKILVADGGSSDNTIPIAERQPKTYVRQFNEQTKMENSLTRNPAGEHINYLIEWASLYKPDWLIFDDCDCVPNYLITAHGKEIFEVHSDVLMATRIHMYLDNQCFPELSFSSGEWQQGLWAWRPETNISFKTNPTNHTHEPEKKLSSYTVHKLQPPYCLLHYAYPDEETIQKKLKFYTKSGQHPDLKHPLETYRPDKLPEWAHE